MDNYAGSESYWRHEQDISADMLRQMRLRCDDPAEEVLYNYCHTLGTEQHLWAPNFFITIAPAEWKVQMPTFLEDLFKADKISEASGMVALHFYHILHVLMKEVLLPGNFFEHVFHYCIRTEFQGRGTVHIHVAVWAIARRGHYLEGRSGSYHDSPLVRFLEHCLGGSSIDVQLGSGWLPYINGYVVKASDAMDFRPSEHYGDKTAKNAWCQVYRLMCKKAPLLSEVYLSLKWRHHMVRSFHTDVSWSPIR